MSTIGDNKLYAVVARDDATGREYVHTYKDTGRPLVGTWDECQEAVAFEQAMQRISGSNRSYSVEPLSVVEARMGRLEHELVAVAA